jgi:hypothetical protein
MSGWRLRVIVPDAELLFQRRCLNTTSSAKEPWAKQQHAIYCCHRPQQPPGRYLAVAERRCFTKCEYNGISRCSIGYRVSQRSDRHFGNMGGIKNNTPRFQLIELYSVM